MKKTIELLVPSIAIVGSLVVTIALMPFNIDTIYDEGYLYLCLRAAAEGVVDGNSQWANILVSVLGDDSTQNVLSLRLTGFVLSLLSVAIFWLLTYGIVAKTKLSKIAYLLVCLFLVLPSTGGIILCYNGLAQFFLITACALLYRICYDKGNKKMVWAFLLGLSVSFSFFTILPSAVVVGFSSVVLIIVRNRKQIKQALLYLAMLLLGCLVAVTLTHFFVADIPLIVSKMVETAQTVTTLNRGYDPMSFAGKTLLFVRDFFMWFLAAVGVVLISCFIKKSRYKWCSLLFFIVSLFCFYKWQDKPMLTFSMFLSVFWIIPLVDKYKNTSIEIKKMISFDVLFNLFLCLFPLLAALGTNVYMGTKICWFLVPWALLAWRFDFWKESMSFNKATIFLVSAIFLIGSAMTMKTTDFSQPKVDKGALKGMCFTKAQNDWMGHVDNILNHYKFEKNKSVVFSTQLSTMALIYFDAVPCGLYFQPMDFVAHHNDCSKVPDFLFLTEYDKSVAGDVIKSMGWGWPEDFDEYYVGTSETQSTVYGTDRWLYCRKQVANTQE